MNDSTENPRFVADAENQSLATSLLTLRRRKRRRQITRIALPIGALAAAILITAILISPNTTPEIAEKETPSPALIVRTHLVADAIIVRSQISPEIVVNSHPASANFIARTDPIHFAQIVITSRPSSRLEFINDQQLLAALGDHPAMLTKSPDGHTRLIFINEDDQHLIREP